LKNFVPIFAISDINDLHSKQLIQQQICRWLSRGIAGQYEIVFKTPAELADLRALTPEARASQLKSAVLPETLPISDDDVHVLATAIAAKVGGHSLIIFPASNGEGAHFTMSGVSEAAMRALAADPRIDVIAAASSEFQDSCEDSRS